MNSYILVWFLVSASNVPSSSAIETYSPAMIDLDSCQRVQSFVLQNNKSRQAQCVQVKIPLITK